MSMLTLAESLAFYYDLGKERAAVGGNLLSMRAVNLNPLDQRDNTLYDSYVEGFNHGN